MTPEQSRAYNRANQDIINYIEEHYIGFKGTQTGAIMESLKAHIYTMQKKTAYKVTHYSDHHAKQEEVKVD